MKKPAKKLNRTAMIMVRLKPDERSKIEAVAKSKGLGVSAWLRMIALETVSQK